MHARGRGLTGRSTRARSGKAPPDLSALDARFNNDQAGASACGPWVMLKTVLLAPFAARRRWVRIEKLARNDYRALRR